MPLFEPLQVKLFEDTHFSYVFDIIFFYKHTNFCVSRVIYAIHNLPFDPLGYFDGNTIYRQSILYQIQPQTF